MSNKDKELDEFWDLSSLIPKKQINKNSHPISKSTKCAEIAFSHPMQPSPVSNEEGSTVIKRYIDPLHDENKKIKKAAFSSIESYVPSSVLLHKVTLKKRKSAYELYESFFNTALELSSVNGVEVPYVPFFSYVPQYDQLSSEQLAYYLWWRDCFKNDVYIKTDASYVLLYAYELINVGGTDNTEAAQRYLAKLWNVYHKEFSALSGKLASWICDFSLLHKLTPPSNIERNIVHHTMALKEFFIYIPEGDFDSCVFSLLKYGTEYDYHSSKFATPKNILFFDKHIFGAMLTAVKHFSRDGKILSALAAEDSKIIRNAFDGAVCASRWRYEIEVEYCSFSRSNELRFIMGDIVKYSENKIRAFLGVKSKLSVYSIGIELQRALDEYFKSAFENEASPTKKAVEKHDYDLLYDLPVKPLSLENAKKIENESWETTHDLISAFEEEESTLDFPVEITKETEIKREETVSAEPSSDLSVALGEYLDFALAIKVKDGEEAKRCALKLGKLPESIVDIINEISFEIISDILIEDNGVDFELIECYRDMI